VSSLRDQLVAKGLASKKAARAITQDLRRERKLAQGSRKTAAEVEAEQRASREAEKAAHQEARRRARELAEAARAAEELRYRIAQVIRANSIRSRGNIRFHHRTRDGRYLASMDLGEPIARKLRSGEAAIVALADREGEVRYSVVSAKAAWKLDEFAPEVVVFLVRDARGISDPSEGFWVPEWDVGLRPHRVTAEEVAAIRGGR
jgi:uncharacterized protein YaiL (DUF2058 family)